MKIITAAVFIGTMSISSPVAAEDLYVVISSDAASTSIVDLDTKTIIANGFVRFWVTSIYRELGDVNPSNGLRGQVHKYYEEYDCTERRARTLQASTYTSSGTFVGTYRSEPEPWYYVIPNTMGDARLSLACNYNAALDRFTRPDQQLSLASVIERLANYYELSAKVGDGVKG